jgi:phosphate uptake regulator
MKRKLIQQGSGGYTVYLPRNWIDSNNLSKGEEIDIEEMGLNLVLSPSPNRNKKLETEIKLVDLTESSIRTLITNTYRAGYDKIKVNFTNEKQFSILQEVVKTKLIGFEIITKTKDSCSVENITEPDYDQFNNLIKKMFLNIDSLFEITKIRLQNKTPEEDYNETEERIIKYDNFCRRTIIKRKLIEKKSEFFWTFLSYILHGQREIYHLNKLITNKKKISAEIVKLIEDTHNMFKLLIEIYENKNIEILSKIHKLEKELIYEKGYSLLETKDSKIVYHLLVSIRQFYLANSPLAGLVL